MFLAQTPHERDIRRRLFGLAQALVLTLAAFGVASAPIGRDAQLALLSALAALQMGVHLVFFLDIGRKGTRPEIRLAVAFAVLLILIMAGGTAWIMSDLHMRMMSGG